MTRTYSRVKDPHRDIILSEEDPVRGDDVKALIHAADNRLDARGVHRKWSSLGDDHGVMTRADFPDLQTAARLLGALEDTLAKRDSKGRPVLTVGVQRMIRFPGTRTPAQLARADARMDALVAQRRAAEKKAQSTTGGPSGLTAAQRSEARLRAVSAFKLLYDHAPSVHYTQGASRWQGINRKLRAADGRFPTEADCSSAYTWCVWNALTGVAGMDFPDIVNGSHWLAGYTGTLLAHGVSVDDLLPGDAVIYGRGFPGVHVAMYAGDGLVYSHGSEAGPFKIAVRYRADVLDFRRFI